MPEAIGVYIMVSVQAAILLILLLGVVAVIAKLLRSIFGIGINRNRHK